MIMLNRNELTIFKHHYGGVGMVIQKSAWSCKIYSHCSLSMLSGVFSMFMRKFACSYESDSNRFLSCYKSELSGLFHTFMRKFTWTCERNWYFFGFSLPSFLQSPISSSFQLWFAHWLKYRIFDFSSFETIYSMPKNDLGKYSKFYLKFIVYVIAKFWFLIRMFEL